MYMCTSTCTKIERPSPQDWTAIDRAITGAITRLDLVERRRISRVQSKSSCLRAEVSSWGYRLAVASHFALLHLPFVFDPQGTGRFCSGSSVSSAIHQVSIGLGGCRRLL